jgi:hypothetical protein
MFPVPHIHALLPPMPKGPQGQKRSADVIVNLLRIYWVRFDLRLFQAQRCQDPHVPDNQMGAWNACVRTTMSRLPTPYTPARATLENARYQFIACYPIQKIEVACVRTTLIQTA